MQATWLSKFCIMTVTGQWLCGRVFSKMEIVDEALKMTMCRGGRHACRWSWCCLCPSGLFGGLEMESVVGVCCIGNRRAWEPIMAGARPVAL